VSPRSPRLHVALGAALSIPLVAGCASPAPESETPARASEDAVVLTEAQIASAGLRWEQVAATEIRQTVRVPGTVDAPDTERASVGAILQGRVARVRVLPGDRVRAGQPLVEIHGHELFDAEAGRVAAEAGVEVAREAAARAERLHAGGAISLQELQMRRATLATAEAELLRATELVKHLNPTPEGNASAVAPSDGTIFSVEVSPGQVVLPGTPLVHMGTTERLWVTAFVPEGVSASLTPGDVVEVEFLAGSVGRTDARLVGLGGYVNPDTRSVEMRFELMSLPAGVRPGSFATVLVGTSDLFSGVELAEDAAVRIGGDDVVFVALEAGRFEPRRVTLLPLGGGRVAVAGLESGARVVVEGAYFLKSAMESGAGATGEGG